jgi:hypothetical protein
MKQYTFAVPCSLEYEVCAETEEEARKILEKGVYPNGKNALDQISFVTYQITKEQVS